MFSCDPEPHVFFGSDIADLTKDIQRVKSAVLRGMLDSLSFALYPRTGVVEGMVNIDDVLNPRSRLASSGCASPVWCSNSMCRSWAKTRSR